MKIKIKQYEIFAKICKVCGKKFINNINFNPWDRQVDRYNVYNWYNTFF